MNDGGVATKASGLTSAEVAERVAKGEVNVAGKGAGRTTAQIVAANVFTRVNAIFGVLFVIVLSTGSLKNALFGTIIVVNSAVGIVQEIRAKRTLDKLALVSEAKPTVRRDGVDVAIPSHEIVVDDIVEMAPGDQIVVDGVVVEASALELDESMLTGEADPVDKRAGDQVRSGSFVVAGSGTYKATQVGAKAYAAQLEAQARKFTLVNSELRDGINTILKVITYLLIPAGLLIIANQLLNAQEDWRRAVLGMVGALVPMVPEGLVLLTSVAFAVGVIRLGRRNCLVNELPAIEGLARVDIVCCDKTGTLTEPGMKLAEVEATTTETKSRVEIETALAALAASDPHPNITIEAIAHKYDQSPGWEVSSIAPFSSARKWSGMTFVDHGSWLVGAPDVLLDPESPVAQKASELGATGLRILLLATSDAPLAEGSGTGTVTAQAFLVLEQKVRSDAQGAIDYFHAQDVHIKVISGDNALSVGAVAASLHIGGPGTSVDARKLPKPEDPAFATDVDKAVTFGRVTPEQKLAMVSALQSQQHTVAMTGDGVNDVLALKQADIGVAMGSGSPAARAVAQIVLLDNAFATLPHVVAEGRRVIGNIERVSRLFLTKTIYAVTLAMVVGVVGLIAKATGSNPLDYPFQPIHMTIVGVFTIGIPAFVMSLAPNAERARAGFVRRVLRLAIPSGLAVAAVTFACYVLVRPGGFLGQRAGATPTQASTVALIALIVTAWWVVVVVARPLVGWKVLLLAATLAAYLPIFLVPPLQRLCVLDPSNPKLMVVGAAFAVAGVVLVETLQRVSRRLGHA